MTVEELLAQLNDLPVDALKKNIFVEMGDGSGETYGDLVIESITESCDDFTVVGYVITSSKQMDLPLNTYDE